LKGVECHVIENSEYLGMNLLLKNLNDVIMKSLLVILSLFMGMSLSAQKWYVDHNEEMQFWGDISIESLKKAPHGDWYAAYYDDYNPERNVVIAESFKDVNVLVYMGTWCSDSQEWVPKFVKLWEANGLPTSNIYLTGLHNGDDKYKQSPDRSELNRKGSDIHLLKGWSGDRKNHGISY
jgi:hypothetical protein